MSEERKMPRVVTSDGDEHWVFVCCLCADRPTFDGPHPNKGFVEHMVAAHGMSSPLSVRKAMSAHLDATNWHQTDYRLLLPDEDTEIGRESVRIKRRGADRALWGGGKSSSKRKR